MTNPGPLSRAPRRLRAAASTRRNADDGLAHSLASCVAPLLLRIKHQRQDVETELRELETHGAELLFCLVAQNVTAMRPESRHRLTNGIVVGAGIRVHVARVCDLAVGGGFGAMDLAVRQRFELGQTELVGEGVDARVLEERDALDVRAGNGRVGLELGVFVGGEALGEVFAVVEVFEEGAHGFEVFVEQLDAALLRLVVSRSSFTE